MKILSIPMIYGGASHTIPLYVLNQRYLKRLNLGQNYFLLPEEECDSFNKKGITTIPFLVPEDIDFQIVDRVINENIKKAVTNIFSTLKEVVCQIRPDIIIEDGEMMTPIISEKHNIPRISIHRTGFFRSSPMSKRNPKHMHSLEKGKNKEKLYDASFIIRKGEYTALENEVLSKEDFYYMTQYLNAKTKLIPGIPSIEILPEDIENRDSYFYTGPLTVEDNPSETLLSQLKAFMQMNKRSKTVFITTGLVDSTSIQEMIDILLSEGYCIITTVSLSKYTANPRVFQNRFLPLNNVCAISNLIIHQCGSGMYHYPILNEKPTLTIGTQCYDREDVAIRLEQLGVSKHIPHPNDDPNYLEIFKTHLRSFENNQLCDFKKLGELKDEIYETMLNFDMREVINYTLN